MVTYHVPRRLEGNPSSRRGTCTLPTGRETLQLARMCLAGQSKAGYPRIPAQAGGYPPAVAVAGADAAFPWKSSRISGCYGASSKVHQGKGRSQDYLHCKGINIITTRNLLHNPSAYKAIKSSIEASAKLPQFEQGGIPVGIHKNHLPVLNTTFSCSRLFSVFFSCFCVFSLMICFYTSIEIILHKLGYSSLLCFICTKCVLTMNMHSVEFWMFHL
jgi:hypothetical protein